MVNYNTQCLPSSRQTRAKPQYGYNQTSQHTQKDAIRTAKPPLEVNSVGSIKSIVGVGLVPLHTAPSTAQHLSPTVALNSATESCKELEADMCPHCGLPLGSIGVRDNGWCLHSECAAECILRYEKEEDEALRTKDDALKRAKREEYDIGWKAESVPHNSGHAMKLGCEPNQHGMYCLKFAGWNDHEVCLAPTTDPAAAVNLEYLAIALKVRQEEGREPLFSLDPKLSTKDLDEEEEEESKWQQKRFDPEWLAGTSVGEVMFQADVHLKLLSMGEYPQPVAGMKSAFEYIEAEGSQEAWSAREWLMVRRAGVHKTSDQVLIPHVEMGVEAREQVRGINGLDDAPVTRPDHPLVKYAESFSHYFDLIAERKSVIYNLRELAKASVLAKFLVDSSTHLANEAWLGFVESMGTSSEEASCLEIPQLWNERRYSDIHVEGGTIVDSEQNARHRNLLGVYGGVRFGLDAAAGLRGYASASAGLAGISPARRPAAAAPVSLAPTEPIVPKLAAETIKQIEFTATELYPGQEFRPVQQVGAMAVAPGAGIDEIVRGMAPTAVRGMRDALIEAAKGAEATTVVPFSEYTRRAPSRFLRDSRALSLAPLGGVLSADARGVDLNLNMFDLSTPQGDLREHTGSWEIGSDACGDAPIGQTFWSSICESSATTIKDSDKALLRSVFNPCFSDRQDEGVLFKPPETSEYYVRKLQGLVKEEQDVQQVRKEAFCDTNFDMNKPGPLFPSSWMTPFKITGGRTPLVPPSTALYLRPDYQGQATRFHHVLKSSTPVFDKSTEDGTRYRVYQIGNIQVRTFTEQGCKESICAFLSTLSPSPEVVKRNVGSTSAQEAVLRVTQYVDRALAGSSLRFYVVLETETSTIVTEKCADEKVTWQENPRDLEARNALAKATRSADCGCAEVTVGDVKAYQAGEISHMRWSASHVSLPDIWSYAQGVFDMAVPIRERSWSSLTAAQRGAVERLGISSREWNTRGVRDLGFAWADLDEIKLEATLVLGFDETSWRNVR